MPEHHLSEDLLLAYAAGTITEAHALVCAVHLTACAACRDEVALLEQVGGALLDTAPVDAAVAYAPAPAATPPLTTGALPPGAEAWPRVLHPYVRGHVWAWFAPGIHVLTTALVQGEMPVRVFRLAPRQHIARHTHLGTELMLVLSGGFVDLGAHYGPGDIAVRDGETTHAVDIDPDGECVALVVNDHPLVPRTLGGKVFALLRRP